MNNGSIAERAASWANNPLARTRSMNQVVRRFNSDVRSYGEPMVEYEVISFTDGTSISRTRGDPWAAYGQPRRSA